MPRRALVKCLCLLVVGWLAGCFDASVDLVDPNPPVGPTSYVNSIGMVFQRIPAGTFMMGSEAGQEDERPPHEVTIAHDFFLGIHEVTQAQWRTVMGDNPSFYTDDDRLPVERVSWFDAVAFIQRLNEREGTTLYRLPTEAEWEYAARAGSEAAFSFGDEAGKLPEYAWTRANAEGRTHRVGQKRANDFGLYDMSGNVWEWVLDWYAADYYARSPAVDPPGMPDGTHRVIRGGSSLDPPTSLRPANRGGSRPVLFDKALGFRVVRSLGG